MTTTRDAFESEARQHGMNLNHVGGGYEDFNTDYNWIFWQAATKAERKPLNRVQVQALVIGVCDSIYPQDDTSYSEADTVFYGAFARAIEAAHGIGEPS